MARKYSNVSKVMALTGNITNVATSCVVDDASGLPITFPYALALDYETSNVEIVLVSAAAGNTLTISRGQEDTPGRAHSTGAVTVHVATALDLQNAANHIEATTDVHGVGASSAVVGTQTSQTLTNKTMSGASNTFSNIPGSAITGSIVTGTIPVANVVGDWPIDTRSTGSIPIDTRTTGNLPIDTRSTGSIPIDTRTTGNLPLSRTSGTIAIDTATTGNLPGTRVASPMNAQTINQTTASVPGLDVVPHATPTAEAVARFTGHTAQAAIQAKRNNSTSTGEPLIHATDESDVDMWAVSRAGATDQTGSGTFRGAINWGLTNAATTQSGYRATTFTATGTSYTATGAIYCFAVFWTPPSGQVLINYASYLDNNGANNTYVSLEILTGGTVGSGTQALAPNDAHSIFNAGTDARQFGSHLHVGLTPNTQYNAYLVHRVSGGTGTLQDGRIAVIPCL